MRLVTEIALLVSLLATQGGILEAAAAASRAPQAASQLPAQVQALLDSARASAPQRYQFAIDKGAQIGATADGRSFYLLWYPPAASAARRTLIVTTHGSASWAFDDFFLWYDAALRHGQGILALQWWFPNAAPPGDYYSPSEVYAASASILKQQGMQPGRALLHGFSRGSANGYYVALFDRVAGNNFFGFHTANAGGASADYPLYGEVTSGQYGSKPFAGMRWSTYCGGLDPNPDRDGCPAMRRTADFLRRYGATVDLTIEDPAKGHGGFHQTPAYIDLALTAFETALLAAASSWKITPDSGFRVDNAGIPNAGWMQDEVWLTVGGTGGIRRYRSPLGDNASRGDSIPGFNAALSGTGYAPAETVPRIGADGARELYVLGLGAPGTNSAVLYRLRETASGLFTRDPQSAVFSGENQFVGVPDVYPAGDGKLRLIYVARGAARQNSRTALSADGGQSFAAEYDNPFNDLTVANPGADNTNVDPAVLKLAQGGYLAVTMRAKKLYLFLSADGRLFLPVNPIEGPAELDAARLYPNATGFFDPTLVQLPDGRIWMYVTVEQGSSPESVVRAELRPVSMAPPLYLPRLVNTASELTGLALVNRATTSVLANLAIYNDDGTLTAVSPPAANPLLTSIPAGNQLARLVSQLWGQGFRIDGGWMEISALPPEIAVLFQSFDPDLSAMDGFALTSRLVTRCVFPESQNSEIAVLNPSATTPADMVLRLIDDAGRESGESVSRRIPPRSRFSSRTQELFPAASPGANGYLSLSSSVAISAGQWFGIPGAHLAALSGLEADAGATLLYAPQYISGGGYKSTLSIINLEKAPTSLSISWFDGGGVRIGQEATLSLAAAGRALLVNAEPFRVQPPASGLQGYLAVSSSATRITGAVRFGDPAEAQFQTALPLIAGGQTEALFAQVAQNATYFTGLAVVNPHREPAQVTTTIFNSTGAVAGLSVDTIPANGRLSKLLSQMAPALPAMDSGYFTVRANLPVVSFALFGTHSLTALSAIPAQQD